MALTKITSNAFAASAVDSDAVGANTITTAKIADTNVTHAKLHTTMDLSSKTVTLPSLSQNLTVTGQIRSNVTGGSLYTSTAGGIPRLFLGGGSGFGINRQSSSEDIFFGEPGDTGTWRVRGAGTISLGVGNSTTTMVVQGNGGNVGIGTSSLSSRLTVGAGVSTEEIRVNAGAGWADLILNSNATNGGHIYFNDGSNAGEIFYYHASDYMAFNTAGSERMRIDSSGRLTVGSIGTDTTLSGGQPGLQVTGSGFNGYMAAVRRDSSVYSSGLLLAKSRNSSAGSFTALQDNDKIGSIIFIGDDGTDLDTYGAMIQAEVNGTPSNNNMPADLIFSTNSGTSTITERMRIRKDGNVGIGTTNPDFTADVTHQATGQTDVMRLKGYTGNAFVRFQDNDNSSDWTFGADDNSGLGSGALIAYDRNNTAYRWALDNAGRMYLGTTTSSNHYVNIRSDQATGILINAVNAYGGNGTSTMLNLTNNTDTDIQFVINEVNASTKYAGIGPSVTGRALVLGAPGGNVGIGTTNPIEALDVDGAIISGNSSKPINATYSSGGNMNSFEHRFNRVKSGSNSPHVLVDIQFTSNFHQAMFVIEYGARLQAVSDSVTNAVIRSFGVNRFNGGNCNVTETNNTHFNSNVSSHAPIYINVVSQTRYQIVVNFSGTLGGSSFVSGSIRGYGVNSEFPTITFSDGLNGF